MPTSKKAWSRYQKKSCSSKKSTFFSSRRHMSDLFDDDAFIPHKGALCHDGKEDNNFTGAYVIEIRVHPDGEQDDIDGGAPLPSPSSSTNATTHELCFSRHDFEFASRLFAILDTESRGVVDQASVRDFVTLRCPVFWRRDDDWRKLHRRHASSSVVTTLADSPTFYEVWRSVVRCSMTTTMMPPGHDNDAHMDESGLGVEAWMVFCRFIALAQYVEAKRRFSARHLQQTMRHRNAPRGSEVVMVDVPPPDPPTPLTATQLAAHERQSQAPLPLPELDLDHTLLAAHDLTRMRRPQQQRGPPGNSAESGMVKISLFGQGGGGGLLSSSTSSIGSGGSHAGPLEFAVSYLRPANNLQDSAHEPVVVRRSMADMKWLDDTFASHRVLGGTLCGRILPPFPGASTRRSSIPYTGGDESMLQTAGKHTGGAIATGVDKIKDAAKSWFGSYYSAYAGIAPKEESGNSSSQSQSGGAKKAGKKSSIIFSVPDDYYNPHSPQGKARQVERYLNYLLEHPALSTSFPLNAILMASQSGLEGAKLSLLECHKAAKAIREQTPRLDDGKQMLQFWNSSSNNSTSALQQYNFPWVRTAAQAAMALKVHGMLETTGMASASARLQHASLPTFGSTSSRHHWDNEEFGAEVRQAVVAEVEANRVENSFEHGVINVQSELNTDVHDENDVADGNDGYDLLPLPVPAPERRILSAGSGRQSQPESDRETRFHYGSDHLPRELLHIDDDEGRSAYLGDISVDEHIDKLREVIGSVDNTLMRCLATCAAIGKARREKQALDQAVIHGLDEWEGMRGRFVSQRALLKGEAGIDQSRVVLEESDLALIDDVSWQASLAGAAVAAAEDVRSAVRISRTAANARATASSAVMSAQSACEAGVFASMEEARAAQTRASIAKGHVMRAAVVEHEAKSVKRRATLALAHDVKCWNVHRKREMLLSCLNFARSQHEGARRAVDAWSTLRDGFIGTAVMPAAHERRARAPSLPSPPQPRSRLDRNLSDPDETVATIYQDMGAADGGTSPLTQQPAIVAVDHNLLSLPFPPDGDDAQSETASHNDYQDSVQHDEQSTSKYNRDNDPNLILPFAMAIPEDDADANDRDESFHDSSQQQVNEKLSASMQSLVDGLMMWGGGIEADEDHFALPAGMAASIILEGSAAGGGSGLGDTANYA